MSEVVKHARYGASSAYRWMYCAGSIRMTAARPPMPPSWYAEEGTFAHSLLSHVLSEGETDALQYEGQPYLGGELRGVYSKDDVLAVQIAVDTFYDLLITAEIMGHTVEWRVEASLPFPTDTGEEAFGTCDILVYVKELKTLYVPDYKHGTSFVDHRNNKQTLYYGTSAAFAESLGWDIETVIPGIIQPRAVHAEGHEAVRWDTPKSAADMLAFIGEVDRAIYKSMSAEPELRASIDACRYCPGNYYKICPEAERAALSVVRQTFATVKDVSAQVLPKPEDIPVERLSYILTMAPLLTNWLENARKYAIELHATGRAQVPGFKTVLPRRRRQFLPNAEEIASELSLISGLPRDTFIKASLIGVTEAETLLKAQARERAGRKRADQKAAVESAVEMMAFLTDKVQPAGITIAPESDARPAYSPAIENFAGVQQIATEDTDHG